MRNERRITNHEQRKTKNEIKARARWDEGAFSPELVAPIPTRVFIS